MADDERVRLSRPQAQSPAHRAQLQRLASQHHASEYSRAKFGIHGWSHHQVHVPSPSNNHSPGAPVRYTPLSLQAPDHFAQLRARQTANAQLHAWWPAPRSAVRPPVSLHDEIMAAMAEPLQRSSQATLKTSLTHPIKYVIPCLTMLSLIRLLAFPTSFLPISST